MHEDWSFELKDTGLLTTDGYRVLVDVYGREWVDDLDVNLFVTSSQYQIIRNLSWLKEGF